MSKWVSFFSVFVCAVFLTTACTKPDTDENGNGGENGEDGGQVSVSDTATLSASGNRSVADFKLDGKDCVQLSKFDTDIIVKAMAGDKEVILCSHVDFENCKGEGCKKKCFSDEDMGKMKAADKSHFTWSAEAGQLSLMAADATSSEAQAGQQQCKQLSDAAKPTFKPAVWNDPAKKEAQAAPAADAAAPAASSNGGGQASAPAASGN